MNEFTKPFQVRKGLGGGRKAAQPEAPAKPVGKVPKWKQQSMQFRQAMQAPAPDTNGGSGFGTKNFRPTQ